MEERPLITKSEIDDTHCDSNNEFFDTMGKDDELSISTCQIEKKTKPFTASQLLFLSQHKGNWYSNDVFQNGDSGSSIAKFTSETYLSSSTASVKRSWEEANGIVYRILST